MVDVGTVVKMGHCSARLVAVMGHPIESIGVVEQVTVGLLVITRPMGRDGFVADDGYGVGGGAAAAVDDWGDERALVVRLLANQPQAVVRGYVGSLMWYVDGDVVMDVIAIDVVGYLANVGSPGGGVVVAVDDYDDGVGDDSLIVNLIDPRLMDVALNPMWYHNYPRQDAKCIVDYDDGMVHWYIVVVALVVDRRGDDYIHRYRYGNVDDLAVIPMTVMGKYQLRNYWFHHCCCCYYHSY